MKFIFVNLNLKNQNGIIRSNDHLEWRYKLKTWNYSRNNRSRTRWRTKLIHHQSRVHLLYFYGHRVLWTGAHLLQAIESEPAHPRSREHFFRRRLLSNRLRPYHSGNGAKLLYVYFEYRKSNVGPKTQINYIYNRKWNFCSRDKAIFSGINDWSNLGTSWEEISTSFCIGFTWIFIYIVDW